MTKFLSLVVGPLAATVLVVLPEARESASRAELDWDAAAIGGRLFSWASKWMGRA